MLTRCMLIDLNEIRYKFTPCGSVGRNGPSLSQCTKWYSERNSTIATQNRLFEFSSEGRQTFQGGQGFQVPRSGLYNMTVAGAAGGNGVCSYIQGKGLLWRGTIELQDTQDLLILVGQRGTEPCEILNDIPVCSTVPKTIEESIQCFRDWDDWLSNNSDLSEADKSTAYLYGGGGAGGGASMVRLRDRSTGVLHTWPSVVAGGGGGAAASMATNFFDEQETLSPDYQPSMEELYRQHLNAKTDLMDIHNSTGSRGHIADEVDIFKNRAGAGGGYFPAVSLYQDGAALNKSEDFALGGYDCLFRSMDVYRQPLIISVHGGFGGGGGQCESGGSGGGYNGGSIFSNELFGVPGSGGYSGIFSEWPNAVSEVSVGLNKESDGYVELVPSKCGCGYECIIYDDLQQFACVCPDGFHLAANEFDCFQSEFVRHMD